MQSTRAQPCVFVEDPAESSQSVAFDYIPCTTAVAPSTFLGEIVGNEGRTVRADLQTDEDCTLLEPQLHL